MSQFSFDDSPLCTLGHGLSREPRARLSSQPAFSESSSLSPVCCLPTFLVGPGDQNSGPLACMVSAFILSVFHSLAIIITFYFSLGAD